MSEGIRVKDEPVDPEYDKILAKIKSEPEDIPDDFFDDIVNDKDLDELIDDVSGQFEDKKPVVIPPNELSGTLGKSDLESSDSDSEAELKRKYKQLKKLIKIKDKLRKRKSRDSTYELGSVNRKRERSRSRHSRKRSRSRSSSRRQRRYEEDSSKEEELQPPRVKKVKEESADTMEQHGYDTEEKIEETEEIRRERVIKICVQFIKTFLKHGERPIKTRFFCTPSVIPLSGVDHLLEYRSPLNHVTNVQFKFSSPSAYVNLEQFGLRTFTDPVINVSKEIGFDVPQLMDKLSINEIPNALKPTDSGKTMSKDGKMYVPFFTDAASQTEEMSCSTCIERKLKTFAERGTMAKPIIGFKSTQTEGEQELPLMNTISLLNSSQLIAMSDFSELIRAPAPTSLNKIYALREKLVEIFNVSQRPCMMPTKVAPTALPVTKSSVQRQIPVHAQSTFDVHMANNRNIQTQYSGPTNQSNFQQYFNRGTSIQQNHVYPGQSTQMNNINMQYPYQPQNGQAPQQHYPQHNLPMSHSQYQSPQPVPRPVPAPVPKPNIRRDDPRSRKEIDITNVPPAPRSNVPSSASTFGQRTNLLKKPLRVNKLDKTLYEQTYNS